MATVNHVGKGMLNLPVTLVTFYGETLHGKVVDIDPQYDFLTVKWDVELGNPMGRYQCEKFSTKMVEGKLTLELRLD